MMVERYAIAGRTRVTAPTAPRAARRGVVAAEAPQVTTNLLSQAYYVDLHLHTSYSLDT